MSGVAPARPTTASRAGARTGRRLPPLQLFASGPGDDVARRPTDAALGLAGTFLLVVLATLSSLIAELERQLAELMDTLPGVFDVVWLLLLWTPVIWAGALAVVAVARGRTRLAGQLVLAVAVALTLTALTSAVVADDGRALLERLVDVDGPPVFPPGLVVVSTAAIATSSPYLTRPFRHFGRWAIGLQVPASVLVGAAVPSGALGSIAVGLTGAAVAHLALGSPGGHPSAARIVLALRGLGVEVTDLSPARMRRAGVVFFDGSGADGPITVKVYGRDAWDAQLLATFWRLAWFRGATRTARLSRVELVEHEAFVTLLAERAGVAVPTVVTAGSAGQGDALVVVRSPGVPLSEAGAGVRGEAPALESLWDELSRLHRAGIVHGHLDLDRVHRLADGGLAFGDLSTASVTGDDSDRTADRAQLLVLGLVLVGADGAVAAARAALDDDGVADLLPYVQPAAVPPLVRRELDERDIDLDDVRTRIAADVAVDEPPIVKLRRVSVGSLVNLALLSFAAYSLIGLAGGLDFESLADAIDDASWAWLALALLLAQVPRIPSAVSTMGSLANPLPLGPVVALQFAISYINLAIPSSAARIAVSVRFLERFGTPPAVAIAAGVIDSTSGFIVQIILFGLLFFLSDVELELSLDPDTLSGLTTIAAIVLVVLLVAVALLATRPSVRERVKGWVTEARGALAVLRSPDKLLQLFGGNVVSQVLFAVALAATIRAFGFDVPMTTVLLINTAVSLFAGLLPVPGGIGVSEAGITLGLTRAGVPSEVAFAAALSYRLASFYLPPVWGWFCYRWLVRQRYL